MIFINIFPFLVPFLRWTGKNTSSSVSMTTIKPSEMESSEIEIINPIHHGGGGNSVRTTTIPPSNNNVTTTEHPYPHRLVNGFINLDGWEHPDFTRSVYDKVIGFVFYFALAAAGIMGNSLVIFAISTDSTVQVQAQLSNLGVLNLAFTDLMTTGLVCLPAAISSLFDFFPFGFYVCKFWSILNLSGIVATMGLLGLISFDRWIAVKWSLHYPQFVTYKRYISTMIAMWVITFACTIFWAYFPVEYDLVTNVCDFKWLTFGPRNPPAMFYGVFGTIVHCLIPSGVILYCNVAIINMSKDKSKPGAEKKDKSEEKANAKVLKAMLIVIVAYFSLTYPVAFIRVIKVITGKDGLARFIPDWLTFFTTVLQFSASIVNPFIYGLFRKDFRDAYGRIFKRLKARVGL